MSVQIVREQSIAFVTVDNPPVNALSQAVRQGLLDAAETLDADPAIQAVVLLCAGRTFMAGADVREFGQPPRLPHLPDVIARIEQATKPWIAAIHGTALGGGLEVALGCRFRIASARASLGLPEVNLGLIPGAGGTVRLPRLAGAARALELIASGQAISATEAWASGVLDTVVPGDDLKAEATAFAHSVLAQPLPLPVCQRTIPPVDEAFWASAEQRIAAQAGQAVAPLQALACIRHAQQTDCASALAFERDTFMQLRGSPQAAAMRHLFFAERAAARPPQLAGHKAGPWRTIALADATAAARLAGPLLAAGLKPVWLGQGTAPATLADSPAIDRQDLSSIDVLIATDTPHLALRPDAVVLVLQPTATQNDSDRMLTLCLDDTRLAEVPTLPTTAPDAVATAFALLQRLGKIPVQTCSPDGTSLAAQLRQSARQAVPPQWQTDAGWATLDAALRGFGFAQGATGLGMAATPDATATSPTTHSQTETQSLLNTVLQALHQRAQSLLAQGCALHTTDIDLVSVHGLGFPRWHGGLMHHTQATAHTGTD